MQDLRAFHHFGFLFHIAITLFCLYLPMHLVATKMEASTFEIRSHRAVKYIPMDIYKDVAKWCLFYPQIILDCVNMWPGRRTMGTKVYFWLVFPMIILFGGAQLIFVLIHVRDLTKMAMTLSTVSTTIQGICKMALLHSKSTLLYVSLKTIWYGFWPANLNIDPQLESELASDSRLVIGSMLTMSFSAVVFGYGFTSLPLIKGQRILPFASWFPFQWDDSPLYEIIYVTQWILNIYGIVCTIIGHDFLFLSMCNNCIGQFKILKNVFQEIGNGNEEKIIVKLKCFLDPHVKDTKDAKEKLLIHCVQHHNNLNEVCSNIQTIFGISCFVQLVCSVSAICLSSFLIMLIDASELPALIAYCLGHVLQLFIYCSAANELTYQSTSLADSIFEGNWHRINNINVKKGLKIAIQRAQRPKNISALNVTKLNYPTFIQVLRLSFSFYTLLSNIKERM